MVKQKIIIGSILEIKICDYYCYAQILGKASYAFFDFKSLNRLTDLTLLESSPVLFILSVYNDVVTEGKWVKVGKIEIRKDLKVLPMQFIQDPLNSEKFELYDPNTGKIIPTTKENVQGLECAAVWEAEHVESRIKDYYKGFPNKWVKQLNKS
jgi:hypothetical protein